MSGIQIRASVDELMEACDKIEAELYGCDICPLNGECLHYNSVEDIWNKVSAKRIQDFLDVADNIESYSDEEKERREEQSEREQREYEEWIDELNRGYYRDIRKRGQ